MHQKRKRSRQSITDRIVHVVTEMMLDNVRTQFVDKVERCFARAEIKCLFFGEFELYNRRKNVPVNFHSKKGKGDEMDKKKRGKVTIF